MFTRKQFFRLFSPYDERPDQMVEAFVPAVSGRVDFQRSVADSPEELLGSEACVCRSASRSPDVEILRAL